MEEVESSSLLRSTNLIESGPQGPVFSLRVDSGNKQAYNESSKFNLLISSTQPGKNYEKKELES